jgi:lysozyme
MKTTSAGLNLIKSYEALQLVAYADPCSSDGNPVTIGYGTTNAVLPNGESFKLGDTINEETAERWLEYHITNHIEPEIDRLVNVVLSDSQYDSIVDFVYNLGIGTFQKSDLLKYINNGDLNNAQLDILHYCKADGAIVRGILRRRLSEAVMLGPLSREELIAHALSGYDPA